MLVLFLILFTNVLADSEEDKYVDLLPDSEKREFIERVARRILKDVQSREDRNNARSGEMSDDELEKHNDYVKAVLKEEADYVRRSKGEMVNDKLDKTSDEKENLDVKPLETEKMAVPDDPDLEQVDLTLRNDRREIGAEDFNSKDFIKVEIVTDSVPIIKRSVQEDSGKKSVESDENTSEVLERVQSGNLVESVQPNNNTEVNPIVPSTIEAAKISSHIELTTARDNDEEIVLAEGKHSGSRESDADAILVKGINEPSLRRSINEIKIPETTTNSDTTISVVQNISVESNGNKSETYTNVTNGNEEITTVNYAINSETKENATTQSSSTTTSTSTTEAPTTEAPTTEAPTTEASTAEASTTTVNEAPTIRAETKTTEYTGNGLDATTEFITESTLTNIMSDEGTTEEVTETTPFKLEKNPPPTESPTVTDNPETSTNSIFIPLTEGMKIMVEDFTSAPKKSPSKKNSVKKRKPNIKHRALDIVPTSKASLGEEKSGGKSEKPRLIYHKLEKYILGPKGQSINEDLDITPKLTPKKAESSNKNFIELEKVYYDNNYKVKKGKEYQVYEIPSDKSPFVLDEDTIIEQPYYVPIYTYSPDNAYFNPQNRLGPNDDQSSETAGAITISESDIKPQLNNIRDVQNVDMEYSDSDKDTQIENQRKKFGGQQQPSHNIHKQPQPPSELKFKTRGKVNPEDYLDSDYYFGRVRKDERRVNQVKLPNFPNSNENDHPAHSIQEGNLKDHVRAVRNILFHQKSFGLLDKDKYGSSELNTAHKKTVKPVSETKYLKKLPPLRTSYNDDNYSSKKEHKPKSNKNKESENNIAIDYYFGREQHHSDPFQKVGYIQNKNTTKELFVMDDSFKENVMKYMEELKTKKDNDVKTDFQPATPLPQPGKIIDLSENRDEISNFRELDETRNANLMINSETNNADKQELRATELKEVEDSINNGDKNPENAELKPENEMDNENNAMEPKLKYNNRRNDDVRVSVYLKVLKDMILSTDNNALKQYDWLGTTVDVQSGLQKIFELTSLVFNNENVHPADMEILKYVLFLHKLSTEIIEANDFGAQLRKKLVLPRNKKKRKSRLIKDKGLVNRVWLYLRREVPEVNEDGALKNLNEFLMNIEDGLYDFHDAIKHIAKITKYRNQQWYQNLKDLYINTDEKHLLEILLHMTVLRFFTLIEESTKNGLEDDYVQYMKDNKNECKRTLEEMMFIMQILADYNKFVE